jgi:hypothetical protein
MRSSRYLLLMLLCFSVVTCQDEQCQEERQAENPGTRQPSPITDSFVTALPVFDGAPCLVCIDISAIATAVNTNWAVKANANPATPQFSPVMISDSVKTVLANEIAKCPAGSNVKVQFMFHCNPKRYYQKSPAGITNNMMIPQSGVVDNVLDSLAAAGNTRVRKVYLASCYSDTKAVTIGKALGLPAITHVVTDNHLILLNCGEIAGTDGSFGADTVRIMVYQKTGNRVVKIIPNSPLTDKQKFDIRTNTVVPR